MSGPPRALELRKHGRSLYCNGECRCDICATAEREYNRKATCADCGRPCQPSRPKGDWQPPAKSRCRRCASLHRSRLGPKPVCDCGNTMSHGAQRCRACVPPGKKHYPSLGSTRWNRRFSAAPGLSYTQFRKLSVRWKLQGRPCTYCGAPMELIDHVVPLSRGGTNYEGNLTPCCAACNMSKHDSFVSYWRHRKALRAARLPVPEYQPRPKPKYRPKQLPVLARCPRCFQWIPNRRNHCHECEKEVQAIKCRNRYRTKVGLPVDLSPRRVRATAS